MGHGRRGAASGEPAAACPARRGRAPAPSAGARPRRGRRTPPRRFAAVRRGLRSPTSTPSAASAALNVRGRRHARRRSEGEAHERRAARPSARAASTGRQRGREHDRDRAPPAGRARSRDTHRPDELRARRRRAPQSRAREPQLGVPPLATAGVGLHGMPLATSRCRRAASRLRRERAPRTSRSRARSQRRRSRTSATTTSASTSTRDEGRAPERTGPSEHRRREHLQRPGRASGAEEATAADSPITIAAVTRMIEWISAPVTPSRLGCRQQGDVPGPAGLLVAGFRPSAVGRHRFRRSDPAALPLEVRQAHDPVYDSCTSGVATLPRQGRCSKAAHDSARGDLPIPGNVVCGRIDPFGEPRYTRAKARLRDEFHRKGAI